MVLSHDDLHALWDEPWMCDTLILAGPPRNQKVPPIESSNQQISASTASSTTATKSPEPPRASKSSDDGEMTRDVSPDLKPLRSSKALLSIESAWFRTYFRKIFRAVGDSPYSLQRDIVIVMEQVSSDDLTMILNFLHTGEFDIESEGDVMPLLETVKYLGITRMITYLEYLLKLPTLRSNHQSGSEDSQNPVSSVAVESVESSDKTNQRPVPSLDGADPPLNSGDSGLQSLLIGNPKENSNRRAAKSKNKKRTSALESLLLDPLLGSNGNGGDDHQSSNILPDSLPEETQINVIASSNPSDSEKSKEGVVRSLRSRSGRKRERVRYDEDKDEDATDVEEDVHSDRSRSPLAVRNRQSPDDPQGPHESAAHRSAGVQSVGSSGNAKKSGESRKPRKRAVSQKFKEYLEAAVRENSFKRVRRRFPHFPRSSSSINSSSSDSQNRTEDSAANNNNDNHSTPALAPILTTAIEPCNKSAPVKLYVDLTTPPIRVRNATTATTDNDAADSLMQGPGGSEEPLRSQTSPPTKSTTPRSDEIQVEVVKKLRAFREHQASSTPRKSLLQKYNRELVHSNPELARHLLNQERQKASLRPIPISSRELSSSPRRGNAPTLEEKSRNGDDPELRPLDNNHSSASSERAPLPKLRISSVLIREKDIAVSSFVSRKAPKSDPRRRPSATIPRDQEDPAISAKESAPKKTPTRTHHVEDVVNDQSDQGDQIKLACPSCYVYLDRENWETHIQEAHP